MRHLLACHSRIVASRLLTALFLAALPGLARCQVARDAGASGAGRAATKTKASTSPGASLETAADHGPDHAQGSDTASQLLAPTTPTSPNVTDPTTLTVSKTWTGSAWQVTLAWSGGTGPYVVVASDDPSFQSGVTTLASGFNGTSLTFLAATAPQFFAVADSTVVSPAVQGMGYDPIPAPTTPTPSVTSTWWGATIQLTASYLDPIAAANTSFFFDLPARATAADAGAPFASWAQLTIPDDARGFYPVVQAHGRSSPLNSQAFVQLNPPGIGPYTSIHGVSWAPQTGHVWIGADASLQQVDLFLRSPSVVRTIASYPKAYISRVTAAGQLIVVDGALGVTQIDQVDVATGVVSFYAATHDADFTRAIQPVGIAVDPDGSACYVADASSGKVVRIPAGAGVGSTIKDTWGNHSFLFPDPCGIDVNVGHQVMVANDADGYVWQIFGESSAGQDANTGTGVRSIEVDADSSTSGYIRYVASASPGRAEAFNLNAISGNPARYHGGTVFGLANGKLSLEPDWGFFVYHHWPQRVVINNSGQGVAYSSSFQTEDRIIQLDVEGWSDVPLRLRVIDPPDLAAYAPDGGWSPASAALPYEGNDNRGVTDFGLSGSQAGPWETSVILTPGGDNMLRFYLKVPAQYGGDNFQVEVTKCKPDGTVLPQRVVSLSPVYTSWKRVFVERDKMFRRGGFCMPISIRKRAHPTAIGSSYTSGRMVRLATRLSCLTRTTVGRSAASGGPSHPSQLEAIRLSPCTSHSTRRSHGTTLRRFDIRHLERICRIFIISKAPVSASFRAVTPRPTSSTLRTPASSRVTCGESR